MNFDLFKKIIDQAAAMKIPRLRMNGYGELLVLKDIEKYFEYIRKKNHFFLIELNTNGNRMSDDKINLFLRMQVHAINISIDGATKATAEAIRIRLNFDQIEANIHRLLALRRKAGLKRPKLRVTMIVIDRNRQEAEQFIDRWRGIADFVGLSGFSNRASSLVNINNQGGAETGRTAQACVLPFQDLNIWADGKAVLCCNDWNEEHVAGDLNTQSLRDVWLGQPLISARKLHHDLRGSEIPICSKCNYWLQPVKGVRLWE